MVHFREQIVLIGFYNLYFKQSAAHQRKRSYEAVLYVVYPFGGYHLNIIFVKDLAVHSALTYVSTFVHEQSCLYIRVSIDRLCKRRFKPFDIYIVTQLKKYRYVIHRAFRVSHALYENSLLSLCDSVIRQSFKALGL